MSDERCVVVVTGGRDYAGADNVFRVLDDLHGNSALIPGKGKLVQALYHGACGVRGRRGWRARPDPLGPEKWREELRGADKLASEWATHRSVMTAPYPAFWDDLGRAAGPIRNGWMLGAAKVHAAALDVHLYLVAFPGHDGTDDCVRQAKRLKIGLIDLRGYRDAGPMGSASLDAPLVSLLLASLASFAWACCWALAHAAAWGWL